MCGVNGEVSELQRRYFSYFQGKYCLEMVHAVAAILWEGWVSGAVLLFHGRERRMSIDPTGLLCTIYPNNACCHAARSFSPEKQSKLTLSRTTDISLAALASRPTSQVKRMACPFRTACNDDDQDDDWYRGRFPSPPPPPSPFCCGV